MNTQKQAGEQMKIRLRPPLREWIKAQAKDQDRSMSWIINKLAEDAYARAQQPQGGAA